MASNKDKGGYDVEFVDNEPNDVTCSICLFVLKEPMQAEQCGHRFCKSCIDDLRSSQNGNIMCPEDRYAINVFKDKGKEREILNTLVKCTNNKHGCDFTKELRDLENHLEVCKYEIITCPIDGCQDQIQRKLMDSHKKDKHSEDRVSILEKRLEKTSAELENQKRRNEDQANEIAALKQSMENLRGISFNNLFYDNYVWKINNFGKKFQRAKRNMDYDPQVRRFFTTKGYKLLVKAYLNGDDDDDWGIWLTVFVGLEQGPFDDTLKWPMTAKIKTSVLRNGAENYAKEIDTRNIIGGIFQKPYNDSDSDSSADGDNGAHGIRLLPTDVIYDFVVNNSLTLNFKVAHY